MNWFVVLLCPREHLSKFVEGTADRWIGTSALLDSAVAVQHGGMVAAAEKLAKLIEALTDQLAPEVNRNVAGLNDGSAAGGAGQFGDGEAKVFCGQGGDCFERRLQAAAVEEYATAGRFSVNRLGAGQLLGV